MGTDAEDAAPPPAYQPYQPPTVAATMQPATVIIQQPVVVPAQPLKIAPDFESYTEYCPYCQRHVMTEVQYSPGNCFWIYLVVGIILCCCFLFCLCCDGSKDAHHFCPSCKREISFKKR